MGFASTEPHGCCDAHQGSERASKFQHCAIIDDVEAMSDMEMSAQGACAISAFEANDIVGLPRSPDRLRGLQNAGRLPRY
jgi:hypothetical protein